MLFVQLFRKESNRTLGRLFTVVFELFLVSAVSHVHSVLRTASRGARHQLCSVSLYTGARQAEAEGRCGAVQ